MSAPIVELERVANVDAVELRADLWQLVVIGDRGTRRESGLYNTRADALTSGKHRIGLVMR